MSSGHTRTFNSPAEGAPGSNPVEVTLVVSLDGQVDSNVLSHRGALRFREVYDLIPAENVAYPFPKSRRRLPSARITQDRPYVRPFSRRQTTEFREAGWELNRNGPPPRSGRWIIAAGLALLGASAEVTATVMNQPALISAEPVQQVLSTNEVISRAVFASHSAIENTLRAFHNARTPEEKCRFVRGAMRMLPTLRDYYTTHAHESALTNVHWETVNWVQSDGITIAYGLYETSDGGLHQYAMEVKDGSCLLDWRSLTGWTGILWPEFLDGRPSGTHTVCVSAVPDTLYSGAYQDAAEWICLRLEDVSRRRQAWAYLRRKSEAARDLAPLFSSITSTGASVPPKRLTLEVAFASPSNTTGYPAVPQLEINRVKAGWFDTSTGKRER